ncbi:MAG: tRNA lysidine(34) synthetase TilS [Thermomicrobiales bacterium]
MEQTPPAPDLLPQLRAAAAALTATERAAPVLVGVSGGPDSLALLHALARWSRAGGPALHAIHVNHHLRLEADADAAQVRAWCTAWDVPLTACDLAGEMLRHAPGGLEQAARVARYQAFAQIAATVGAHVLALGHHADDQVETLVLHLARGAGLAGLAAWPVARRDNDLFDQLGLRPRPAVWRPWLTVRRATILAYCRAWNLTPLHDASNGDLALRRNAVRHDILPTIERHFPGATTALARGARLLADDEAFLVGQTEEAWRRCASISGGLVLLDHAAFRTEHHALQRRLVRRAWLALRGSTVGLTAEPVEAACDAIVAGRTGGRWLLPQGVAVLVERTRAVVGPAATLDERLRRELGLPLFDDPAQSVPLTGPGVIPLSAGWGISIAPVDDADTLPDAPGTPWAIPIPAPATADQWCLRGWHAGDRVVLPGVGTRKLQDWFVDRHVPRYARRHIVLLAAAGRVCWAAGLAAFQSPECRPDQATWRVRVLYNGQPHSGDAASEP